MALPATAVWEIMADGLATNGGFFVTGATGVDYSQSASAHASVTDLVIGNPDNTTITSASEHPFDADCVGNGLYISAGTGFTPGWYQIVSVVGVIATLDRACGTAGSTGGSGKIGGAITVVSAVFAAAVPGHKYWIRSGTHTLLANCSMSVNGTLASPINIEGYSTTRGDKPTGTNRPLIASGANTFEFLNGYVNIYYLRKTGTNANGLRTNYGVLVMGCRSDNTSSTANRSAFYNLYAGVMYVNCEATCTNGYGFGLQLRAFLFGCYAHDCGVHGAWIGSAGGALRATFHNCIFDTCTTAGIFNSKAVSPSEIVCNSCTFYNCGTAVNYLVGENNVVVNSIIDSCTVGISSTNPNNGANMLVNNNFHGNGTDLVNNIGLYSMAVDPKFVDAPNGNFTIGSVLRNMAIPTSYGGTTANYQDVGAAQHINEVTGGGK